MAGEGAFKALFLFFLGGAGEMAKRKCDFECAYLDDSGECEAIETECIGDMCECWKCCQNCTKTEDCDNIKY